MKKPDVVLGGPSDMADGLIIEIYDDGDVLIEHTDERRYVALTRELLERIALAAGISGCAPKPAKTLGQDPRMRALQIAGERLRSGKTASLRKEPDGTWSVNVYRNGKPVRQRFATRQAAREAFWASVART